MNLRILEKNRGIILSFESTGLTKAIKNKGEERAIW